MGWVWGEHGLSMEWVWVAMEWVWDGYGHGVSMKWIWVAMVWVRGGHGIGMLCTQHRGLVSSFSGQGSWHRAEEQRCIARGPVVPRPAQSTQPWRHTWSLKKGCLKPKSLAGHRAMGTHWDAVGSTRGPIGCLSPHLQHSSAHLSALREMLSLPIPQHPHSRGGQRVPCAAEEENGRIIRSPDGGCETGTPQPNTGSTRGAPYAFL